MGPLRPCAFLPRRRRHFRRHKRGGWGGTTRTSTATSRTTPRPSSRSGVSCVILAFLSHSGRPPLHKRRPCIDLDLSIHGSTRSVAPIGGTSTYLLSYPRFFSHEPPPTGTPPAGVMHNPYAPVGAEHLLRIPHALAAEPSAYNVFWWNGVPVYQNKQLQLMATVLGAAATFWGLTGYYEHWADFYVSNRAASAIRWVPPPTADTCPAPAPRSTVPASGLLMTSRRRT